MQYTLPSASRRQLLLLPTAISVTLVGPFTIEGVVSTYVPSSSPRRALPQAPQQAARPSLSTTQKPSEFPAIFVAQGLASQTTDASGTTKSSSSTSASTFTLAST